MQAFVDNLHAWFADKLLVGLAAGLTGQANPCICIVAPLLV